LALSFVLSIVRYVTETKLPVGLTLGLTLMFVGMQWRMSHEAGDYKSLRKNIFVFVATLFPISFLAYNRDYGFDEKWYRYVISYILAILIFYLFKKTVPKIRPLVFLGKISYSLYLLHAICLLAMQNLIARYEISLLSAVSFFLLSSLVVSILSYHIIEKPAVKAGRKIIKNI
jgi:peptidoglycan/LPS O-acetylase OafA/YrhL